VKPSPIISEMLSDRPFSTFLGWITLGAAADHDRSESLR
jgi:hypothetical protein